jgi:hypothetical protein
VEAVSFTKASHSMLVIQCQCCVYLQQEQQCFLILPWWQQLQAASLTKRFMLGHHFFCTLGSVWAG